MALTTTPFLLDYFRFFKFISLYFLMAISFLEFFCIFFLYLLVLVVSLWSRVSLSCVLCVCPSLFSGYCCFQYPQSKCQIFFQKFHLWIFNWSKFHSSLVSFFGLQVCLVLHAFPSSQNILLQHCSSAGIIMSVGLPKCLTQ